MNKLSGELQRLYCLPAQASAAQAALARNLAGESPATLDLLGADGAVRALVLGFPRGSDWSAVAALCEGLQADLELPAPAVAVSPRETFQVWLSLAEPIPLAVARRFLEALRARYLAEVPVARVRLYPGPDERRIALVPGLEEAGGRWSAFIDPSLGSMFSDEPGLDMAPNEDRQADMLAGLASMSAGEFQRALGQLEAEAAPVAGAAVQDAAGAGGGEGRALTGGYTDPQAFLLAVMNDPSAPLRDRIEAAKALLPHHGEVAS